MAFTTHETPPDAPRVLVVDDDPATRLLLRKVLTQSGFAITTASGGSEALTLALEEKYDAILLDLVMPQPDGFAVLREITASARELLGKIIVITGYPQQAVSANAFALVSKPLDLREVVRLLQQIIQTH